MAFLYYPVHQYRCLCSTKTGSERYFAVSDLGAPVRGRVEPIAAKLTNQRTGAGSWLRSLDVSFCTEVRMQRTLYCRLVVPHKRWLSGFLDPERAASGTGVYCLVVSLVRRQHETAH